MRGETLIFRQNDDPLKLYDLTTDFRNSSYISFLLGLQSEKSRQFSCWPWEVNYFDFNTEVFVI